MSCVNTYAYIAHFNSFVGYVENLDCMSLTRQSALNDFVSNVSVGDFNSIWSAEMRYGLE